MTDFTNVKTGTREGCFYMIGFANVNVVPYLHSKNCLSNYVWSLARQNSPVHIGDDMSRARYQTVESTTCL
jgi:hypothetical protein